MIESSCQCGALVAAPESNLGQAVVCKTCRRVIHLVCAEQLAEGSGAGDFDGRLTIESGPQRVGQQLLLGGVMEIAIGKQSDKQIVLPGTQVSRFHCKLVRRDFGPSRWEIRDNKSTNGLFVNDEPVCSHELQQGDAIQIGEYKLRFGIAQPAVAVAGGPVCPSCNKALPPGAKICTQCGVDAKTGRSLVVSKGLDEDDLAIRAYTWIRTLSWICPLGIFPIASEAYGMKKPLATWIIFGITVAASVLFLISILSADDSGEPPAAMALMQWNGDRSRTVDSAAMIQKFREIAAKSRRTGARRSRADDDEINDTADHLRAMIEFRQKMNEKFEFRWYQLFTSALLHEPVLIRPFLLHLGGNMLFLLVFGLRVNELVGNRRMAIIYPLLAVASGLAHHLATASETPTPSLGASGAIMGLAGMYFVFFPAQRVHMAIWARLGILTGWRLLYKLFRMRGFWLLVMWVGLNDILPMFIGASDSVAHWAHLGGFLAGATLAVALLITRQVSALGSDILSVALGRRAWALVGRPGMQLETATR